MNRKLRFTWGHIAAFMALIFIGYVVFMGITYYTLGNYLLAGVGAGVSIMLLIVTTIGGQYLKGASTHFYKAILWERALLFLSLPVILLVYIPYNHFWNVQSQEASIVENFRTSIKSSRKVFADYEEYAKNRKQFLADTLMAQKQPQYVVHNRLDELDIILLSDNYTNLKNEAYRWIDDASADPSVWNVFLFGNIGNIQSAISGWSDQLAAASNKILASEATYNVEAFDPKNVAASNAISRLDNINEIYRSHTGPNPWGVISLAICYLLLMFPHVLQERNARNCERFWDFGLFSPIFTRIASRKADAHQSAEKGMKIPAGEQPLPTNDDNIINRNQPIATHHRSNKGAPI